MRRWIRDLPVDNMCLMTDCAPTTLLQINQDTYAREEHKWDDSDLEGGPREERFPSTLFVPEGASSR